MSSATDPIADFFTLVRNANRIRAEKVDVPASKIKLAVAKILREEGYITNYKFIEDRKQGILRIFLKYTPVGEPVLKGIKRVSHSGLRIYTGKKRIPRVFRGLGITIMSTSKGILTDKECRQLGIGGEVIGQVW